MRKLCTYLKWTCSAESQWLLLYTGAVLECDCSILEALFVTTMAYYIPKDVATFSKAVQRTAIRELRGLLGRYTREISPSEWSNTSKDSIWRGPEESRIIFSGSLKFTKNQDSVASVALHRPFPELLILPFVFIVDADDNHLYVADDSREFQRVDGHQIDRQLTEYIQRIVKLALHEDGAAAVV